MEGQDNKKPKEMEERVGNPKFGELNFSKGFKEQAGFNFLVRYKQTRGSSQVSNDSEFQPTALPTDFPNKGLHHLVQRKTGQSSKAMS